MRRPPPRRRPARRRHAPVDRGETLPRANALWLDASGWRRHSRCVKTCLQGVAGRPREGSSEQARGRRRFPASPARVGSGGARAVAGEPSRANVQSDLGSRSRGGSSTCQGACNFGRSSRRRGASGGPRMVLASAGLELCVPGDRIVRCGARAPKRPCTQPPTPPPDPSPPRAPLRTPFSVRPGRPPPRAASPRSASAWRRIGRSWRCSPAAWCSAGPRSGWRSGRG
jgi:hypothetical protein